MKQERVKVNDNFPMIGKSQYFATVSLGVKPVKPRRATTSKLVT